jgi:hypothetical protein
MKAPIRALSKGVTCIFKPLTRNAQCIFHRRTVCSQTVDNWVVSTSFQLYSASWNVVQITADRKAGKEFLIRLQMSRSSMSFAIKGPAVTQSVSLCLQLCNQANTPQSADPWSWIRQHIKRRKGAHSATQNTETTKAFFTCQCDAVLWKAPKTNLIFALKNNLAFPLSNGTACKHSAPSFTEMCAGIWKVRQEFFWRPCVKNTCHCAHLNRSNPCGKKPSAKCSCTELRKHPVQERRTDGRTDGQAVVDTKIVSFLLCEAPNNSVHCSQKTQSLHYKN